MQLEGNMFDCDSGLPNASFIFEPISLIGCIVSTWICHTRGETQGTPEDREGTTPCFCMSPLNELRLHKELVWKVTKSSCESRARSCGRFPSHALLHGNPSVVGLVGGISAVSSCLIDKLTEGPCLFSPSSMLPLKDHCAQQSLLGLAYVFVCVFLWCSNAVAKMTEGGEVTCSCKESL